MKERYVSSELTGGFTSSKLNITHPDGRGRFVMDPEQSEQLPNTQNNPENSGNTTSPNENPGDIDFATFLGRFMSQQNPQAAREMARNIVEAARANNSPLTQEMLDLIRNTGYEPSRDEVLDAVTNSRAERVSINTNGITDQKLVNRLRQMELKYNNPDLAKKLDPQEDLNALYDMEGVDPAQIEIAIQRLGDIVARGRAHENALSEMQRYRDFHTFVLQFKDMQELDMDSTGWLNNQFNILYAIAEQGAELDSPQVRALESKFNDAVSFLVTQGKDSKEVRDFQTRYNVTIGILFGRASIDRRSLEGIQRAVARLGANGLLTGFSFDEGRVGAMYNRIVEMAEDLRIREGGFDREAKTGKIKSELQHLTPEMIFKLQQSLEDEQFNLALNSAGVFGNSYDRLVVDTGEEAKAKEQLRADIRRAVRTAYGAFGVSQRQAVIASRGRQQTEGPYDFFTDPKSIFDMFNVEELLTGKWKSLNHEQQKFFKLIKLDLAQHSLSGKDVSKMSEDELLELGTRLFRDLFVVPDFFSSGWRIKGTVDKINDLQLYHVQNKKIIEDIRLESSRYLIGDGEQVLQIKAKIAEVHDYISSQEEMQKTRLGRDLTDGEKKKIADDSYKNFVTKGISVNGNGKKLALSFNERTFFTSRFNNQIRADIAKEAEKNSRDLALFMRLKAGQPGETKKEVWGRIQKYRAEEMIRIVRERSGKLGDFGEINEIDKIFKEAGVEVSETFDARGQKVSIRAYDAFKKDYGPVLSSIREKALRDVPPRPVDFRKMTNDQKAEIDRAMKKPDAWKVVDAAYNGMDRYIEGKELVTKFLESTDYVDIYNRVLAVDDTIMDQIEAPPENSGFRDGELSGYWSSERGGDALVRNYNDLAAAQEATGSLVSFLKAEGQENYKKHAEKFAHHVADYNGVGGAAKAFRYTYGSYLIVARQDYLWDTIGIGKAPFRRATSEIERIFGQSSDPLTREFLLKEMDNISGILSTEDPDHHKAAQYYNELMMLLGTDAMSRLKDKSLQVFLYIALLLLLAPVAASAVAIKETAK